MNLTQDNQTQQFQITNKITGYIQSQNLLGVTSQTNVWIIITYTIEDKFLTILSFIIILF